MSDTTHHTSTARAPARYAARRLLGVCLLGLAVCWPAGCGYTVGSPYSETVRSVYVPIFQSNLERRGFEFALTEAVQKQIQMRTHFRLVNEPEADTRLTGRIVGLQKQVLGRTQWDDARELQVNMQVEVVWEDLRTGEILASQRVPIRPDVVQVAGQSEFAPEVGQSLATASQDTVQRVARNIVDLMESPW